MEQNERIAKLEVKEKDLRKDVEEIKDQVTNHIPSAIAGVQKVVNGLRDTHIAEAAVSKAWDTNLKKFIIGVGIVWTLLRIIEFLMKLAS